MISRSFLSECFSDLTDEKKSILVSQWAEENRYLPPELSPKPGYWDNDYAPYLTEIMDCMSVSSPVRKVAILKGAQIGMSTAVENGLGYWIQHAPAGIMYVSADKDLTEMAFETKVERLLDSSGLRKLISSQTNTNLRRTGDKATYKEFPGGFIYAIGARNPGKLRSMSVKYALLDEIDGMPDKLGNEGSPEELIEIRTRAFESSRKLIYLSTPVVTQTSKIWRLWNYGDMRRFFVPCKHCGEKQVLEFKGRREDGETYGLQFEIDEDGHYINDSAKYKCIKCGKFWENHDKAFFLPQGEWRPEKKAFEPNFRSYHIPALLSPIGIYSWNSLAIDWLKAYDEKSGRVISVDQMKLFRQTVEGLPWEERGEAPSFERVIMHRRGVYSKNQIPNEVAFKEAGSPILLLTAAGDIHKNRIDLEIKGWCRNGVSYSIDWRQIEGDTNVLSGKDSPWNKMRNIIESEVWTADDGKMYRIQITLIDARYNTDAVYSFCAEYSQGVYPIMGRDSMPRSAKISQFAEYESKIGTPAYNINTTIFKDRIAAWLRKDWISGEMQPLGYLNFPQDYSDDYFRQYQAEHKVVQRSKKTNMIIGYYWKKVSQDKPEHAWDCCIYNTAAIELLAYKYCTIDEEEGGAGLDMINWNVFWNYAESGVYYA